jgi:protein involved in polysaccharide export with SLBB domain
MTEEQCSPVMVVDASDSAFGNEPARMRSMRSHIDQFGSNRKSLRFAGPGINLRRAVLVSFLSLCGIGCHGSNHYYAEDSIFGNRLPNSLRLAKRENPKTVNLSKLASNTGASDTIGVGDVVEVMITAGLSERDQVRIPATVRTDGTIFLPQLGMISVAGVEPQVAESIIQAEAMQRELYRNPAVAVEVTRKKMNKVRVLGAVKNPGFYELPPNSSDVVSAIASAGGLADEAGQKVEITNPVLPGQVDRPAVAGINGDGVTPVSLNANQKFGMQSYEIELISAAKSGDGQYLVHDGGVVMVEEEDPQPISVIGLVRQPGEYKFPIGKDLSVLGAISLAGGMSNQLADKIYVVRQKVGSRDPVVIQVSLRDAKRSADSNLALGPGDVVSVEHTPATVFMEGLNIIRFGINGSTALF